MDKEEQLIVFMEARRKQYDFVFEYFTEGWKGDWLSFIETLNEMGYGIIPINDEGKECECERPLVGETKLWCCNICGKRSEKF